MESGEPSVFDSIKKILLDRNFYHVKPLGKGSFGDVFSAITPTRDRVAIKMIKNENSWPFEERIWPVMKHPNVLELLDIIDVADLNLKLYIMPRHRFVLNRMVAKFSFLSDSDGLQRVKRWLLDVLNGLEYMHKMGYAHLDIKSDNVLISCEDRAILCDFSGINPIGVHLKRLCAPREYCPPEWYDPRQTKEGSSCDIWLFGLMTLQVLTGHWPCRNMRSASDVHSWKRNVQPVIVEALNREKFIDIMKEAFRAVDISINELLSDHDFVSSIMKWDPYKRPSLQQIMDHPFLQTVRGITSINNIKSRPDEENTIVNDPHLEKRISPKKNKEQLHRNETNAGNVVASKTPTTNPFIKDCIGSNPFFKNNPFLSNSNYQNYLKYMSFQNKKGKTLIKSPFWDAWTIVTSELNTSPLQQSEMADENNDDLAASETPNEETDRNLQQLDSNDKHVGKDDLPLNKQKLGGKIKHWVNKKWKKFFHRSINFVKLSEESE